MDCELRRLSGRTVRSYGNNAALFLQYAEQQLQVTEIEKMEKNHIRQYIKYLMRRGMAPSYINTILKSIRALFKFALAEGYIKENPAEKVHWQSEGKVLIETFTDEEVRSMLKVFTGSSYLSVRNRLIIALAFDTGARNTELCELQCDDVRKNIILIHGKGNKERHVPMTPYLRKLLLQYERIKNHYFQNRQILYQNLLLSRTGKPLTKEAVERVFHMAGEKAKVRKEIRCSPHTARHYYAQSNLRNGLDVYSLSRLLGHENINITKRYLQSLQDESVVQMAMKTSPISNLQR